MKVLHLLLWVTLSLAHAQTASKELLRDGLFAEESEGDLKTATAKYQALLEAFEKERKVAAVALFRLASIKRKQSDEKAALILYENFAKKFGDIEPQATLVKENYLALSGKALPSGNTAITEEEKELARLKKLKTTSPDLFPNVQGLEAYVKSGWLQVIRYLATEGVNPSHERALHWACYLGNSEIVKALLSSATQADTKSLESALSSAASSGHLSIVKSLLDPKYNPQKLNPNYAFETAIRNNHIELARFLASKGATLEKIAFSLFVNKEQALSLEMIRFIVAHGGDVNAPGISSGQQNSRYPFMIPLHDAIYMGQHDMIERLLKVGAKIDLPHSPSGIRPIHIAAKLGDEKMLNLLIDAGANLDKPTNLPDKDINRILPDKLQFSDRAYAPIDFAPDKTKEFLLKKGAKSNFAIAAQAAYDGNVSLMKALLDRGFDPNQRDLPSGKEPVIELAFKRGHGEIAELLLKHGADLKLVTWWRLPPNHRRKFARQHIYPALNKSDQIHIAIPKTSSSPDKISQAIAPSKNLALHFLKLNFPFYAYRNSNQAVSGAQELEDLKWTLIRAGAETPLNPLKIPFDELLPGDIIELSQFQAPSVDHKQRTISLATHPSTAVPNAVSESARFPLNFLINGEEKEYLICPGRHTYDATSNLLPDVGLGLMIELIYQGLFPLDSTKIEVSVKRGDLNPIKFSEMTGPLQQFLLKQEDQVAINVSNTNIEDNKLIRVELPGIPGGWYWSILDGFRSPTLLQVIAKLNSGFIKTEFFNGSTPILDPMQGVAKKIIPTIDLEQIKIIRNSVNPPETITINLAEKIESWKADQDSDPFDFRLERGDVISLKPGKSETPGFSKETQDYLSSALSFTVVVQSTQKAPEFKELTYKEPVWQKHPRGIIPLSGSYISNPNLSFLQSRAITSYLKVNEELKKITNVLHYWPNPGDELLIKPYLVPSKPNGTQRATKKPASTSQGTRTRYVPRPK